MLQGKSREVIVRELQRTNLNVNEAVNNLLSRDDDEIEDLDETSEAYLHEELLSLLDAGLRSDGGGAAALLDPDNIYSSSEGYEYIISRDLARRREGRGLSSRIHFLQGCNESSISGAVVNLGDPRSLWKRTPSSNPKNKKIIMCFGERKRENSKKRNKIDQFYKEKILSSPSPPLQNSEIAQKNWLKQISNKKVYQE